MNPLSKFRNQKEGCDKLVKLYRFDEWNNKNRTIKLVEWESDEIIFKEEFLKIEEGWIVIDVGAEVGYYTILAGQSVGNTGKVLAIEPHPQTYLVLRKNIELYGLNNVVSVCKAVGNKTGEVKLYEGTSSGATNVVSPRPLFDLDSNRFLRWLKLARSGLIFKAMRQRRVPLKNVPIDTLDRITKENSIERVDLVKIDVQGAELDVLKGSHNILEKHKPILLVEVHPRYEWKPETLYKLLQGYGYSLKMQRRRSNTMIVAHFGG